MKWQIVWQETRPSLAEATRQGFLVPSHILAAVTKLSLPVFPGLTCEELFTRRVLAAVARLGAPGRVLAIGPSLGMTEALTYPGCQLVLLEPGKLPNLEEGRFELVYLGGARDYWELRGLLELFRHVACPRGWGIVSNYDQKDFVRAAVDDFLYSTNNPHIYIRGGMGDMLLQNNWGG